MTQTVMGWIGLAGLVFFFCTEILGFTKWVRSLRNTSPTIHADVALLLDSGMTNPRYGDPTAPVAEYAAVNEARYQIVQARRK